MEIKMQITEITGFSETILSAVQNLLPQLTDKKIYFGAEELTALLASENSHLFVAKKDKKILGMLTLTIYRIPTGLKTHIDDVVVDRAARGKGTAEQLMRKAMGFCKEMKVDEIGLTSHPSRESANRLYLRLGFEQYETNLYRYKHSSIE